MQLQKTIGTGVYFIDGCVIEHDYIYLATQLEDLDPENYAHTRMSGYDQQNIGSAVSPNGWGYHDVPCNVVSVCVKQATATEGRRLCALSKEGEVEIFSGKANAGHMEKIPDAGLRLSQYQAGVTGYVTHIREIDGVLHVCGLNGQVYRRTIAGWIHWDDGLFSPMDENNDEPTNNFNCIDGNTVNDVYVVGDEGTVFHFDGTAWRRVSVNTDEHLHWVRCYGRNEVYVCGGNGVLLRGNARDGFKDVSTVTDNLTWWSLAKFGDKVYLAAPDGLFAWDGTSIAKVNSGLTPEIETYHLDSNREALWSFGAKDLTTFDGTAWARIHHPDNPRIGP